MLPVQLSILPRLQGRLNAKVRQRCMPRGSWGRSSPLPRARDRPAARRASPSDLSRQMRQARKLEGVRIEINDLKGRLKGLYNYTSNLTPFFFFSIGGYLVVQGQLSLGALVAALAAYKEIAPAMRELFDFAQAWSDANARFEEVTKALGPAGMGITRRRGRRATGPFGRPERSRRAPEPREKASGPARRRHPAWPGTTLGPHLHASGTAAPTAAASRRAVPARAPGPARCRGPASLPCTSRAPMRSRSADAGPSARSGS